MWFTVAIIGSCAVIALLAACPASELEQLKNDGLISEEEYSSKRKEILGEL